MEADRPPGSSARPRSVADDDRALGEMEWPIFTSVAGPLLGLALIAITIATMVMAPDADGPLDPAAVAAVLATGIPWLAWFAGHRLVPEGRAATGQRFCHLDGLLAILCAVNVAGGLGWIDLGTEAAPQLIAFPALFVVALDIASRSRRRAVLTACGGYVTILIGIVVATDAAGRLDVVTLVAWHAAFLFAVGTAIAVRRAIVAIHRSGDVLAREAAEAARRRVARDVHDVVAHTLAVTMLHISAARMAVGRGSREDAIEALEEAERHGRSSLADIRRMVHLLRSDGPGVDEAPQPTLDDVPDLVEGFRGAGLPVELAVVGPTERVSLGAGLALYRAAQEALANAARHGRGPAHVQLRVNDEGASLVVDNPVDPGQDRGPAGSGLLGMHERIAAAGGTLTANREGERWAVRAMVPVVRAVPVGPTAGDGPS